MGRYWQMGCPALLAAAGTACGMDVLDVPGEYPTIQAAIVAATDGDEVLVAPGTYPERIDLLGRAIAVRSSGGATVTTIDGGGAGVVVSFVNAEDRETSLEGFTIVGGQGALGGGIACPTASPTIRDCVVRSNGATLGAGMYVGQGGVLVERCTFLGNQATGDGGAVWLGCCPPNNLPSEFIDCVLEGNDAGRGGGLFSTGGWLEFRACRFEANGAFEGGGVSLDTSGGNTFESCAFLGNLAEYGGAIAQTSDAEATLRLCAFSDNQATGDGGAVFASASDFPVYALDCTFSGNSAGFFGGAIASVGAGVDVARCDFDANTAEFGGAVAVALGSSGASVAGCAFTGNAAASDGGAIYHEIFGFAMTDSGLASNTARWGGALLNYTGSDTLARCTFAENIATSSGGACYFDGDGSLTDCVFTENAASARGGAAFLNELDQHRFAGCTFERNTSVGLYCAALSFPDVVGSSFRNHPHGAIETVENDEGFYPTIGTTAFCGNGLFDIQGPYQDAGGNTFSESCDCPADWDGSGTLEPDDVLAYLNDWAARDPRADINLDRIVDTRDLLAFLNLWIAGC